MMYELPGVYSKPDRNDDPPLELSLAADLASYRVSLNYERFHTC